ncbi:hypothetical protein WJX75_007070 [Coccomyxa subellipsoidea]|uniref:Pectin acetylesterase n=1 Tax=Coccomyxa subellipsoidea TaxID=248742 RepID=A0ABR2YCD1_9CHLO
MQLHTITHVDQLAVCNDGSPGAYYHRNGAVDNSTRWVIRFLGGAWCWDGPSCAARNASTPYLMSTSALPAQTSARTSVPGLPDVVLQSHGITSWDPAQNPHFNSWNHVHVWYCSSDSHLGDASPGSGSAFGAWQFRGRRIAAAVIADLLAGRGLSEATHVLLTGDSAGGVGVMNLADDIAGTLRDEAPDLEMVKLFVDAGWFLDISPYANRSDGMTFEKCAKALPASYGAVFDRSCEQHFGAISSWRCFFAQDCQAFIETPALFHEYLYDSANLGYDGAGSPAEAEDFRSRMEASIKAAAATGWNGSCDGGDSEGVSLNNTGARLAVPQAAVVPGGGVSRQGNENGMGLGGQDCEGVRAEGTSVALIPLKPNNWWLWWLYRVTAYPEWTAAERSNKPREKCNTPGLQKWEDLALIYAGQIMEDDKQLKEYSVPPGCQVCIAVETAKLYADPDADSAYWN